MAESIWKAQEKQKASPQSVDVQKKTGRVAPPGRAVLLQALLSGVSPDYLPVLMAKGGAGLSNSMLLDLLSRQPDFAETPFRPLPETPPDTVPFLWTGPAEMTENDMAADLPAPLAASPAASFAASPAASFSAPMGGAGPPT